MSIDFLAQLPTARTSSSLNVSILVIPLAIAVIALAYFLIRRATTPRPQDAMYGTAVVPARSVTRPEPPEHVTNQLLAVGWQLRSVPNMTAQTMVGFAEVTISVAPNGSGGTALAYMGQAVPASEMPRVEATVAGVLGPALR